MSNRLKWAIRFVKEREPIRISESALTTANAGRFPSFFHLLNLAEDERGFFGTQRFEVIRDRLVDEAARQETGDIREDDCNHPVWKTGRNRVSHLGDDGIAIRLEAVEFHDLSMTGLVGNVNQGREDGGRRQIRGRAVSDIDIQ